MQLRYKNYFTVFFLILLLMLSGCGKSSEQKQPEHVDKEMNTTQNETTEDIKKSEDLSQYCIIETCEQLRFENSDYCENHKCHVNGCTEEIGPMIDDQLQLFCLSHYYCFVFNGYEDTINNQDFLQSSSIDNDKELFSKIMPFIGMNEKYVGATVIGDNYKYDVVTFDKSTKRTNRYIWYKSEGRKLINLCFDSGTHLLQSIALYYDNVCYPYYRNGEHPSYENYIKSRDVVYLDENTEKQKTDSYDPYAVYDYNDPDDFAEDLWEEFDDESYEDGYDEAYDYWEEHH